MSVAVPADEWAQPGQEPPAEQPAQPVYPSVAAWMAGFLGPTWRRSFGNGAHSTWCPSWWRHAEAVDRLTALWRAWERLRLVPDTGMDDWWQRADYVMGVLTDTRGPFSGCSPEGHGLAPAGLVLAVPPAGLFE